MGEKQLMLTIGLDHLLSAVVFLLLTIFGIYKRMFSKFEGRVEELEHAVVTLKRDSIGRTEFNQTVKLVRDEIRQGNSATHRRLDQLLLKFVQEA